MSVFNFRSLLDLTLPHQNSLPKAQFLKQAFANLLHLPFSLYLSSSLSFSLL
jgi:hypothetical protein